MYRFLTGEDTERDCHSNRMDYQNSPVISHETIKWESSKGNSILMNADAIEIYNVSGMIADRIIIVIIIHDFRVCPWLIGKSEG